MRQLQILFLAPLLLLAAGVAAAAVLNYNQSIVILAALGIVIAAITVVRPVTGLVTLLLAMLFSPDVPIGPANEFRTAVINAGDVLIITVTLGWLMAQARRRGGLLIPWTPVQAPIMAMAAVIALATLFGVLAGTVEPVHGFFFSLKRIEYFVVFFVVTTVIEEQRHVNSTLVVFVAACIAMNCVGLIQHLFFPYTFRSGIVSTFGQGRANTLGGFYTLMIVFTLGVAAYVEKPALRLILVAQFVISCLCLLLSYSRGAYVALPFAIVTVLLVDMSRRILQIVAWLAGAVVITVFFLWVSLGGSESSFLTRQAKTLQGQIDSIATVIHDGPSADPSMGARWAAWQLARDEVSKRPLFGYGVGSRLLGWYDNQFVREAVETGLIGLAVFLWMNLRIFLSVLRLHRTSSGIVRGMAAGFLGGHAGLLVQALTIENFYTVRTMEPFWFLLGLLMATELAATKELPAIVRPTVQHAPQTSTT